MALYVNTNTSSINAQRNLNKSTNALSSSYTKLASGNRINSAKDDAAGLTELIPQKTMLQVYRLLTE